MRRQHKLIPRILPGQQTFYDEFPGVKRSWWLAHDREWSLALRAVAWQRVLGLRWKKRGGRARAASPPSELIQAGERVAYDASDAVRLRLLFEVEGDNAQ